MQTSTIGPVRPQERIQTIDIIRGIALFGILTIGFTVDNGANAPWWPGRSGFADQFVYWSFRFFVDDKFQNIYCFLFGLGFAILMQRAAARNSLFWPVFIWRMILLYLIGAVLNILTAYPVVILDYAMAGILLLLFWKIPVKLLPILAILFALLPWTRNTIIELKKEKLIENRNLNIKVDTSILDHYTGIYQFTRDSWLAVIRKDDSLFLETRQGNTYLKPLSEKDFLDVNNNFVNSFSRNANDRIYQSAIVEGNIYCMKREDMELQEGRRQIAQQYARLNYDEGKQINYVRFVKNNAGEFASNFKRWFWHGFFWNRFLTSQNYIGIVLTLFLLGLYAGKRNIFYDIPGNRSFIRKAMFWGLLLGSICILITLGKDVSRYIVGEKWGPLKLIWNAFIFLSWKLGAIFMSIGIVAFLTLQLEKKTWRKRLAFLSPVGRMGLTNYILQALATILIFSNLGLSLSGKFGGFYGLLLAIPVCVFIALISRLWFNYFKYGPFEWLWRSLTYLKFQPMRLKRIDDKKGW
jgi:uncharacterized membrane protein YeiB